MILKTTSFIENFNNMDLSLFIFEWQQNIKINFVKNCFKNSRFSLILFVLPFPIVIKVLKHFYC